MSYQDPRRSQTEWRKIKKRQSIDVNTKNRCQHQDDQDVIIICDFKAAIIKCFDKQLRTWLKKMKKNSQQRNRRHEEKANENFIT